jgi:hypothetical protein
MDEERYRSGRNGVDSKSICLVKSEARGFESHPLRQETDSISAYGSKLL